MSQDLKMSRVERVAKDLEALRNERSDIDYAYQVLEVLNQHSNERYFELACEEYSAMPTHNWIN